LKEIDAALSGNFKLLKLLKKIYIISYTDAPFAPGK